MDNIVDYLVILFFIISGLASLLKKKKTEENQKAQRQGTNSEPRPVERRRPQLQQKPAKRPVDPFEEISDMIRQNVGKKKSEVDQYFEQAIKESEQNLPPVQKKKYASIDERSRTNRMAAENKQLKDLEVLKKAESTINKRAREIRDKLKDVNQVRELIIINEILNKPKALRTKTNL